MIQDIQSYCIDKHSRRCVMAWARMAASDILQGQQQNQFRSLQKDCLPIYSSSSLIGRNFNMQQDNDPEHTANSIKWKSSYSFQSLDL